MKDYKNFYEMGLQYHMAAVNLWCQIIDIPYYYNPAIYLLRHSIELLLKGLILKNCNMEFQDAKKKITIGNNENARKFGNVHSILALWEKYKETATGFPLINVYAVFNQDEICFLDNTIKKYDKIDLDSTKYRYPVQKNGQKTNTEPIVIDRNGDVAPDLSKGIPTIIQCSNEIAILESGKKKLEDGQDLFNVAEFCFSLYEKMI